MTITNNMRNLARRYGIRSSTSDVRTFHFAVPITARSGYDNHDIAVIAAPHLGAIAIALGATRSQPRLLHNKEL